MFTYTLDGASFPILILENRLRGFTINSMEETEMAEKVDLRNRKKNSSKTPFLISRRKSVELQNISNLNNCIPAVVSSESAAFLLEKCENLPLKWVEKCESNNLKSLQVVAAFFLL